jgi:hypothetical protein
MDQANVACRPGRVHFVIFGACLAGCASAEKPGLEAMGSERQSCYPNQTCNAGLICRSDLCVKMTEPNDGSAPAPDTGALSTIEGGGLATPDHIDQQFDAAGTPLEGGLREIPLPDVNAGAYWSVGNDCLDDPRNCTIGGNEPDRNFDGAPYCTKGTTARFDNMNWGVSMVLGFGGTGINATAAGIVGFAFDLTGTSPPGVDVETQSETLSLGTFAVGSYGTAQLGKRSFALFDQQTTPPGAVRFDPSKLILLSFHVSAQADPVAFDFCVANLTAVER